MDYADEFPSWVPSELYKKRDLASPYYPRTGTNATVDEHGIEPEQTTQKNIYIN
jgi:hypothetical protein